MDINADRVIIKGGSEAAVSYGIQTLHKALPSHQWSNVGFTACRHHQRLAGVQLPPDSWWMWADTSSLSTT